MSWLMSNSINSFSFPRWNHRPTKHLRARIMKKINQDGDQARFSDIITECVDFLTTYEDCLVLAKVNVQLNAV
jgi:hypothetical protein